MIRIYELFFYQLYVFSSRVFSKRRGRFQKWAVALLSMLMIFNVMTLLNILDLLGIPPSAEVADLLFYGSVLGILVFNHVKFSYREKYLAIMERYKNQPGGFAGNALILLYILVTIGLLSFTMIKLDKRRVERTLIAIMIPIK